MYVICLIEKKAAKNKSTINKADVANQKLD